VELKLLMQYLAKGFESICEFNHQHGSGVAWTVNFAKTPSDRI
jgi:hypothetical protein